MGRGRKGKKKSKTKTKAKPAPKKKTVVTTGKGMGPRGKLGTAQSQAVRKRFKDREAKGLSGLTGGQKGDKSKGTTTMGNYRAAQKKQVQDAARKRNATFQANKKAKAAGGTSAQVAKDNAMYGNTFPSGAIGISEAGKAQAAANKAEFAAKRTAPEGGFNISAAGRAQAEANKAAAAAKAQAEAKSAAESRRLAAENARRIAAERAAAKAEADRVAAAKKAAEEAAAKREAERIAAQKEATRKSTFDPRRANNNMVTFGATYNNPLSSNNYFNLGRNVRIPNENTASLGTLVKDDLSQITRTDKAFKEGATGVKGFRPFKAFTPNMVKTGPTPLVRQTVERFLPAGLRNISLGSQIFNQGREDSGLTQSLNQVGNINAGGLSIGFKSDPSTDVGARLGNFITGLPGKVADAFGGGDTQVASAGGLNISGNVDSGDASKSNVGRALTFTKNLVQQPKAALAFGADVASELFSPRLGDGTLTGNMDFAGRLPGDEGFDMRDVNLKSAVNAIDSSRFAQQVGENIGLPKDFKTQTKDALAALGENFKGATADRDGIYKGISETAKNLTLDPRLAPIAKFLNESTKDDPKLSNTEQFKIMGIDTPVTQETAGDIISAFQPDTEKFTGLSKQERGLIEGGGGNRIISGKLTDAAREAITGLIGSGDSLNLPKGTPLSISNMLDAGGKIISNVAQGDTLASKRIAEIDRLSDKAGKITTPSLIKGLIPRPRLGGSRVSRPNAVSKLGSGVTTLAAATPTSVEEVLPLPTTTVTQTGTDASNLASIMRNAYENQMSIYGMDPNYSANFRQPRFNRPRKRFRQVFNRGYF